MQLYQLKFPNGKGYIGITSQTAKERFSYHCRPSIKQNACQRAIHKYGKESVVINVLAECDNWELLCLAEIEAIEKFNTFTPNGYNLTLGGEGKLVVGVYGKERAARDKEERQEWYKKNKERIKENRKKYLLENKEIISLKSKKYYQNNKKRISEREKENIKNDTDANKNRKERAKKYADENREIIRRKAKENRDANKDKINADRKLYRVGIKPCSQQNKKILHSL